MEERIKKILNSEKSRSEDNLIEKMNQKRRVLMKM